MANDSEFIAYLLELLEPFGAVRAKRMFGGHGLFKNDLMFALVADDTLFFKADDDNRNAFEQLSLPRFTYLKQGKPFSLSYYQAPEETLEQSDAMCGWAHQAYQAALRGADGKRRNRKTTNKPQ